jgi:hypothetical protein
MMPCTHSATPRRSRTPRRVCWANLDVNRCAYATVPGDADIVDLHGNYTHETHSIIYQLLAPLPR